MSEPPEPIQNAPRTNQSGGINVGNFTSGQNTNLNMNEVADRDLSKITNSPGASIGTTNVIHETPRRLTREGQLALAMVAQRFQVQPVKADMPQPLLSSTLRPKGGFAVYLTPRA